MYGSSSTFVQYHRDCQILRNESVVYRENGKLPTVKRIDDQESKLVMFPANASWLTITTACNESQHSSSSQVDGVSYVVRLPCSYRSSERDSRHKQWFTSSETLLLRCCCCCCCCFLAPVIIRFVPWLVEATTGTPPSKPHAPELTRTANPRFQLRRWCSRS